MTGTSTPRPCSLRIISGTAAAASSVLTVTRTSCEPAWARRATWIAVASGSAVSVFVIDWTTIGWAEPTSTPPTSTLTVGLRRGRSWSGEAMRTSLGRGAAQDPGDVEAADPDEEGHQDGEPDDVRQALGLEADPRPEDRAEHDHQHPAAVERGERQDVDESEVRRQDACDIEREDRPGAEEDVANLGRDADRAGDGRGGRRIVDEATDEIAQAGQDQPEPVDGLLGTDRDRRRQVTAVRAVEDGLETRIAAADAERALRRPAGFVRGRSVDLGLAAKRRRDRLARAVGPKDEQRHRQADVRLEIGQDVLVAEELVLVAVDREDRVARLEPGRGGGRAGLDLRKAESVERRRQPGDDREDQERRQQV